MGTLTVSPGAIVYVDANALIYAVEGIQPFANLLRPVWDSARLRAARLIGSELLIVETLTGPLKRGNQALAAAYEQILHTSDLELLPVTADILRRAADLRASYGLKTPDAIHAATALNAGCSMYLTNDVGFRRVAGLLPTILNDVLST